MTIIDFEHYRQLVRERGVVLRFPGDCGCETCQMQYAWIEDGCPGQQEAFDKIKEELDKVGS